MHQFDAQKINIPKAMVTSMLGHEDMIDYMSTYRTQDKFKGKHYNPKGALFWFTCNKFGEFEGSCCFIKNVPDEELMAQSYNGYRKMLGKKKPTLSLSKIFTRDIKLEERTFKKLKLYQ